MTIDDLLDQIHDLEDNNSQLTDSLADALKAKEEAEEAYTRMFDREVEVAAKAERLEIERDSLRAQLAEVREALDALVGVQNGPPLPTPAYERDWNEAMAKARAALSPPSSGVALLLCAHCPHPSRCREAGSCTCSSACPHSGSGVEREEARPCLRCDSPYVTSAPCTCFSTPAPTDGGGKR